MSLQNNLWGRGERKLEPMCDLFKPFSCRAEALVHTPRLPATSLAHTPPLLRTSPCAYSPFNTGEARPIAGRAHCISSPTPLTTRTWSLRRQLRHAICDWPTPFHLCPRRPGTSPCGRSPCAPGPSQAQALVHMPPSPRTRSPFSALVHTCAHAPHHPSRAQGLLPHILPTHHPSQHNVHPLPPVAGPSLCAHPAGNTTKAQPPYTPLLSILTAAVAGSLMASFRAFDTIQVCCIETRCQIVFQRWY